MKQIKDLLPKISISHTHKQWKFQLMQQWSTIMGNLVSKVSIHKIYNNSIVLGVSDSSWMQELYMLSNLIKKKINATLDEPRIETIRFQYVAKKEKSKQQVLTSKQPEQSTRTLTHKEKKALEKISDPELSEALQRLLTKCHH
ncbi:MAG: hypothetical protein CL947_03110 [Epsilonproteobacteria bacterium]|nr:hypothetical protein [Campylobacterota bacterium]|tara:strand:- start:311 stop:739 length:429 start_codon:yes stop_codon:yes gene_type:complete